MAPRRTAAGTCRDVACITLPDPDGAIVAVECGFHREPHRTHRRRFKDRRGRTVTLIWPTDP